MNDEILNVGLNLAMEWGENWLQPIQDRLRKRYSDLTCKELDLCNAQCQAAMEFGHNLVAECLKPNRDDPTIRSEYERRMREAYPWISDDNLSHNFSQAMYYTMK